MSDLNDQTAATAGISLHELRLINIGLHCIKGKAGIDIDKFTKMAGYKSNSVASTTWSRVKRHLQKAVPVVEPDESDDVEDPKDGVKKRKRVAKKVNNGSDDEAGPSKKQARGKKAQKDESGEAVDGPNTKKAQKGESGDKMTNEPNTKKARVKKAAPQPAVKNGATPDEDKSVILECITVKDSGDKAGPSTNKSGETAQKGKAGAVKKGKGKNDDASDEDALATKADKKKGVAVKRKGKVVQGSDASDDDINDGKAKDAAKAGKNKGPAAGKGARQTKTGKDAPEKASKKAKDEDKSASDGP